MKGRGRVSCRYQKRGIAFIIWHYVENSCLQAASSVTVHPLSERSVCLNVSSRGEKKNSVTVLPCNDSNYAETK